MAIPNFYEQSQSALRSGMALGQGLTQAAEMQRQRELEEQQAPFRQQLLEQQAALGQAQVDAIPMQQEMSQLRLNQARSMVAEEEKQRDSDRSLDMVKQMYQDAGVLAAASYDREAQDAMFPNMINFYQQNYPELVPSLNELYSMDDDERTRSLLQTMQSLKQVVDPEGSKKKKVQNTQESEGGTLITYTDGTQEFKPVSEQQIISEEMAAQRKRPKLTAAADKKRLELEQSYIDSSNLAEKAQDLASRFSSTEMPAGFQGSANEMLKNFLGTQDQVTSLRQEFTRLRNNFIVEGLPQGPATDKDIEMVAKGFPEGTSNPQEIANFLSAMARVQKAKSQYIEFQSNFLLENGNLTKAKRDFIFGDTKIKKGESLRNAYDRYTKDEREANKEMQEQQAQAQPIMQEQQPFQPVIPNQAQLGEQQSMQQAPAMNMEGLSPAAAKYLIGAQ